MFWLLLACTSPVPSDSDSDSLVDSSGAPEVLPHTLGDPLTPRVFRLEDFFVENVAAEALSSERGILAGVESIGLYDADGVVLDRQRLEHVVDVAVEGDNVLAAARSYGNWILARYVIQDDQLKTVSEKSLPGRAVAVSMAGELALVVLGDGTTQVRTLQGQVIRTLEFAEAAQSVRFVDDERALVGHGNSLALLDVQTGDVLASIDLPGPARHIRADETRVVVALGSEGVAILDPMLTDYQLLQTDAMRLDLDGDDLWIAGWDTLELAWLGEGGPALIGQERPGFSAMAVGASGGRAWVADWIGIGVVDRNPGVTGPELHIPVSVDVAGGQTAGLTFENRGPMELEFTFDGVESTLAPYSAGLFTVAAPDEGANFIQWSSNDLDEPEGTLRVLSRSIGLGGPHPDFTLPVFDPTVNEALTSWTLSENLDEPVLLVYWAEF
jgi:hypothetical protein